MLILRVALAFSLVSVAVAQNPLQLASPNGQIVFTLSGQALLHYAVTFRGKPLIDESELGLDLQGQPPLGPGWRNVNVQHSSADDTYTIPVGKTKEVRDHYNSLIADFSGDSGAKLSIEVRAFDDGVAFRYVVPEQPAFGTLRISGERTQFRYSNDATLYPLVVNGFQSSYEDDYQMRTVGSLHPDWLIALPLLAQVPGTGWVAITEANIDNYAGMYLRGVKQLHTLKAELSPHVDLPGVAVETRTPFKSPWRVLMIGEMRPGV